MNNNRLTVFDTTLRDGAQTPGIGINIGEKIRIALQLERLGVDFMEVGFPASSNAEFEAVSEIARRVERSGVVALARASESDIDRAASAIRHAVKPRIHTFISSSDIHIKHKLNMTREQVLEAAVQAVQHARTLVDDVQFGFEDGSRTDPDYLCELCEAVIAAGAGTVNIADTVGFALPDEFGGLIRYVFENTPNIGAATVSVHCHDDLGLATANTIEAVRSGVRQVEVTVNGIGERAGNTAMEEVIAALHTKAQTIDVSTGIVLDQIYPASRLVAMITGITVPPNKAVVGDNAFCHESGIHQDGYLKSPLTYQIMTPEEFGVKGARLVLGKQSGKHGLRSRLAEMGWNLDDETIDLVYRRFKDVADRKRSVNDEDLEAILTECLFESEDEFRFRSLGIVESGDDETAVRVEFSQGGELRRGMGRGAGPVKAVFDAIEGLSGTDVELLHFSVNALSDGIDAQGEAIVRLRDGDHSVLGRAIDPDIIVACAKAYIDGLNRVEYLRKNPVLRTGQKWAAVQPAAEAAAKAQPVEHGAPTMAARGVSEPVG